MRRYQVDIIVLMFSSNMICVIVKIFSQSLSRIRQPVLSNYENWQSIYCKNDSYKLTIRAIMLHCKSNLSSEGKDKLVQSFSFV